MKYLFTLLAVVAFSSVQAQVFKWNKKSADPMAQEVQPNDPSRLAYERAYNERQTGLAGIYNPNMERRRTSMGETYVGAQMTASHAVLPLGTIVRVENLDNGKMVNVRINDKGQECGDCLITLSKAAAENLGISYRGRVSVERTGFSNWNPAPPARPLSSSPAPNAYRSPQTYQRPQVTQPVEINRNDQWQARGSQAQSPTAYGSAPTTYRTPNPYGTSAQSPVSYGSQAPRPATGYTTSTNDNYAVMRAPAPSVTSREVQPANVSRQPQTYSRYPTATAPAPTTNYGQPQTYSRSPQVYQPQATYQQAPATTQAAPPASTVKRVQESRTVPAPATYQTPAPATPSPYVPSTQAARSVAAPTAAAPASAPASGTFTVQLGAYSNELYAKNRVAQLNQIGLTNVFYKSYTKADGQVINRVYAGTFTTMAEAQTAAKLIQGNYQMAGIVSKM